MKNLFCNNCKQLVGAKPELGIKEMLIIIFLSFLLVVPAFVYWIYIMKSDKFKTCPICLGQNFDITRTKIGD